MTGRDAVNEAARAHGWTAGQSRPAGGQRKVRYELDGNQRLDVWFGWRGRVMGARHDWLDREGKPLPGQAAYRPVQIVQPDAAGQVIEILERARGPRRGARRRCR